MAEVKRMRKEGEGKMVWLLRNNPPSTQQPNRILTADLDPDSHHGQPHEHSKHIPRHLAGYVENSIYISTLLS